MFNPLDEHLNLFWHYGLRDRISDHENNVTRAFVATLNSMTPGEVRRVLEQLVPNLPSTSGDWQYGLQQSAPSPKPSEECILLGISPDVEAWEDSSRPAKNENRRVLDAVLRLPDRLLIGVESKLSGGLDRSQTLGHLHGMGLDVSLDQLVDGCPWVKRIDWATVASAFKGVGGAVADAFCEYLEMLGLERFSEMRPTDEWAWHHATNDWRAQTYLRGRLEALGRELAKMERFARLPLIPKKMKGSFRAGPELSLRWGLQGALLENMTLNVFLDPSLESANREPRIELSVYVRSFDVARLLSDGASVAALLQSVKTRSNRGRAVIDVWQRPSARSRWNARNLRRVPDKGGIWPLEATDASDYREIANRVRAALLPGVPANEQEYQPSLSLCAPPVEFAREDGRVLEDVASVAEEFVDVMKQVDVWTRQGARRG